VVCGFLRREAWEGIAYGFVCGFERRAPVDGPITTMLLGAMMGASTCSIYGKHHR